MHARILPLRPGLSALAAFLAAAVGSASVTNDAKTDAVAAANTAFALDLYRQLSAEPGNLVFSPYSISDVLAMARVGARGQTATEMAAVLHLALPPAQVAAGFAGLAGRLDAAGNDGVALVTANSLWAQPQTGLTAEYVRMLQDQFRAEAVPVDFVRAAEAARTRINDWVDKKTRGKITELIGPGVLDAQTRMVLCNAIYFKGRWAGPFDPQQTRPAPFFLTPTQSVNVPTMQRTSKVRTIATDGLRLLALPYTGKTVSMVILLPDPGNDLANVGRSLTPEKLAAWLGQLDATRETEVDLSLPRFSTTASYDLGRRLAALGMPAAFNPGAADFSGMTGDHSLFLSNVIHKAIVEVNEEGTVAAAASGTVYFGLSVARALPVAVDHPFLFLIRDNATGTLLFVGRIVDPR
jgi:serpin B